MGELLSPELQWTSCFSAVVLAKAKQEAFWQASWRCECVCMSLSVVLRSMPIAEMVFTPVLTMHAVEAARAAVCRSYETTPSSEVIC